MGNAPGDTLPRVLHGIAVFLFDATKDLVPVDPDAFRRLDPQPNGASLHLKDDNPNRGSDIDPFPAFSRQDKNGVLPSLGVRF